MKTIKNILDGAKTVISLVSFDTLSSASKDIVTTVVSESAKLGCDHTVFIKSAILKEDRLLHWGQKFFPGASIKVTSAQSVFELVKEQSYDAKFIQVVDTGEKAIAYRKVQHLLEASQAGFSVQGLNVTDKTAKTVGTMVETFDHISKAEAKQFLDEIRGVVHGSYDTFKKKITETRQSFFMGETFNVGENVAEGESVYEIIDRGSNYVTVINESGTISRKFLDGLSATQKQVTFTEGSFFKGLNVSDAFKNNTAIVEAYNGTIEKYKSGQITDAVAILKAINLVETLLEGKGALATVERLQSTIDRIGETEGHSTYLKNYTNMVNEDKQAKLEAARIIAGAVGVSTVGTDPSALVNAAIKAARLTSNPNQIQILKDMLKQASKVGLTYDKALVESLDNCMRNLHKDMKLLKEKPTADVLKAHQDLRKIGPDYAARDIGGKREMIKDILAHNHGPRALMSYKGMKKNLRDALEVNELSTETLKSYSQKAREGKVSHKADPLKTALNRFKGQNQVTDRIHNREMKKVGTGQLKEAISSAFFDGPGKGTPFKDMPADDHLKAMNFHHTEWNAIRTGKHGNSTVLHSTGMTDKKMIEHAKFYHAHKEYVKKNGNKNTPPKKIKESLDAMEKDAPILEVHNDPDYDTEREVFGYEGLKKQLAKMTGIENYGDKEPGKAIDLKDAAGTVVSPAVDQTKPGHSLNHSNNTHRHQLVRKLKNHD